MNAEGARSVLRPEGDNRFDADRQAGLARSLSIGGFFRALTRVGFPRAALIGLGAVGVALVATGCGSSSSRSTTSSAAESSTTTSAAAGGGQDLKLSADPSGQLSFDKTQLTAKAGTVTMTMTNPSSSGIEHGIAIEGNGVDQDGQIVQPVGRPPSR